MAPLNPKDWAEAAEKLDKVSARLLVGLLAPALVLQFGPWFVEFRSSNEHWFVPTLVVLLGIVGVRCIWWVYGLAAVSVRRGQARKTMQREILKLSLDELEHVVGALQTDCPALCASRPDRGITLLCSKGFVESAGFSADEWEYQFLFNHAVWDYLKEHPDTVAESAKRFRPPEPGST